MISYYNPDYTKTPYIRKKIDEGRRIEENKKTPEVSIITAFYNTGNVFWETFYAIVNQTFRDFEWLIVNDGSTKEEALKILSEVEALDERIKVINNPHNMRLGPTRNNGVRNAKGSFLFLIDSDDLVEFTFLEKCLLCLKLNPNYTFVGAYTIGFDAKKYLWQHGYTDPIKFLETNYAVNCFVCRRFIFDKIEYAPDLGGMEDWDFWLHAASLGYWGYTIPEFLYWYRERQNRANDWPDIFNENKRVNFIKDLNTAYRHKLKHQSFDVGFSKISTDLLINKNDSLSLIDNLIFIIDYSIYAGQIKLIKDYIQLFKNNGARVTIIINSLHKSSYNGEFLELTDDVFILDHLAAKSKHPQILEYLITSRNAGRVIAINLESGLFFAPYLKEKFSQIQFDVLIISVNKDQQVNDLTELYNLNTSYIDNIGVSSNGIKLFLETDSDLYEKTYYIPPVTGDLIQPFSATFSLYQKYNLSIPPGTFVITCIGEILSTPGFFSIHHVVEQLKKESIHHYQFVFFGWGVMYEKFQAYIFEKKIENKVTLINVNPADPLLPDKFAISDTYLDMHGKAGYNDEVRFALYKGLPIISVGNELMKDIIDKNIGFLCSESYHAHEISHFIARSIITLIHFPELQNRMKNNCIKKALTILQKENRAALQFCNLNKRATGKAPLAVEALTKNILALK